MAEIVKELTLEVYSANRIKAIIAKQYDYKSRFLLIRLTDSGEDISVEPSSVVTVNAFRPNGESAAFLGSAESDGRVLVPLSYWMLELEGTVKCDVSIVDTEGRKLSSTNFQIEVERANYSGDDIEQDEHYDLLVELLAEVAQAQEAENARVAAETARVTAENGRVSAETARQTAETARATAETARDTAEGARSSAETARGTAETARASAETTRQSNEASRVSAEAARVSAETAREEAEEEREHALDDYAKKDGYYEGLTAGLSENLTPYSEDSGIKQTQPFFLEGTATGNGESVADAGTYAFLQEKRGNMVCVNQKLTNPDFATSGADWAAFYYGGVKSWNNGILTISRTGNNCDISQALQTPIPAGHTLLFIARLKTNNANSVCFGGSNSFSSPHFQSKTSFDTYFYVGTPSNILTRMYLACMAFDSTTETVMDVDYIYCTDLTQWFNGNIPAYLLSHPEAFGRYYKGPLTYEPGRLEPATGRYLTSVGRNIWDEEWESGTIAASTGVKVSDANKIRSKNYISITSSTTYYVKDPSSVVIFQYDADKNYIGYIEGVANTTFTTDSTCHYIYFVCGSSVSPQTTYNHDITISLYYSGESGYDKYYPHEVLATIDTGTESLYSAGSAYDSKVPSGLITRRVASVDLGTLDWAYSANGATSFRASVGTDIKSTEASEIANILCSKYTDVGTAQQVYAGSKTIAINGQSVWVYDPSAGTDAASFKAAMAGVMLYYKLATPTTEQGTPFQETVPIDDFGQLSWSNTDVPQGNQIFYPVDYKAAIDTLINYTDGDMTSLALKDDITDAALNARGYYKMEDLSSSCISANDSNLTFSITKAVKMNGLVNLTLRASNGTGASISAGTVLFTLSNNTHRSEQIKFIGVIDTASQVFNISSIGQVTCNGAIADGSTLHLYVSFIVT